MANEEQIKRLTKDVEEWNEWRDDNPEIDIDLSGANLRKMNLQDANLLYANLTGADLAWSDLDGAVLFGAQLIKANLMGTMFTYADLKMCNFTDAVLGGNSFGDSDLSQTIGLDTVRHWSRSYIATNTFSKSKGKISELFLRGCGLSDWEIEMVKLYRPGLDANQITEIAQQIYQLQTKSGIQYYSCFISYNSRDETFARQLYDDLQNNGVRCWFASEDMKIGDPIRPRIDQEIRLRDKLLVILSENSIRSEWVGDEVEGALEEENRSNRPVLFPIRLDAIVMNTHDDWAAKIKRRRHIGDFSNWKDKTSYQKAFKRLLQDLKATGE
jgi:hypothetical protein